MKSIKKFLFIMAALAAISAFVSCSNGDDDGPSKIASYTGEYGGKATFYDNGTFYVEGNSSAKWSAQGTYSGNLNMNGSIVLNCTKYTENGIDTNAGGMTITVDVSYNGKELMLYPDDYYDDAEKYTRD